MRVFSLRNNRLAVLLMPILVSAQAAPAPTRSSMRDLSGTWLSISDKNATDVVTASQLPNALLTITAGDGHVSLERSWSGDPIKAAYVCDGRRENSNGYSIVVERTTCRWDPEGSGALVIEGSIGRAEGPATGRLRERYRLDADGVLHVERSREVFSLNRGPAVTTSRYRRVSGGAQKSG